jgi:hypothetical protein
MRRAHVSPTSGRRGAVLRRWPTALTLSAALLTACSDPTVPDYNNPSSSTPITDASTLQSLVSGIAAGDREQHAFQILVLETMGRDAYRFDTADPRYTDMPLGGFSPGAFLVDFTWNVMYRTIRGAQELVNGIESSGFSAEEKAGARGYARTMKGNQYLRLIDTRDTLGVPIALGTGGLDPVRCKPAVLEYTSALLDTAAADLAAGGASFVFELPAGFTGFDTPATFRQFNRALAAKIMTYRAFIDYGTSGAVNAVAADSVLRLLDESFENHTNPAGLRTGVYHDFSTASGDLTNSNFDQSVYRANPKVLADLEPGDRRAAKLTTGTESKNSNGSLRSNLLFTIVNSPTAPLPIITNAELVLIRAEALWGLGRDAEALALVNFIRAADGGLGPVAGLSHRDLLLQILKQKRLSLLWESGSRLVDFRMFGLIPELGTEAIDPGHEPDTIPFPQAEIDARGGNLACS